MAAIMQACGADLEAVGLLLAPSQLSKPTEHLRVAHTVLKFWWNDSGSGQSVLLCELAEVPTLKIRRSESGSPLISLVKSI